MNIKETENNLKSENNINHKIPISNVEILPNRNYYDYRLDEKAKARECFIAKILIAIIYFALIICLEQVYREDLFDESIDAQEDIRKDHNKNSAFYNFWKFLSYFGVAALTFPIFAIILVFFPLSSSFLTLQALIYSIYFTNFLKIIYRNGRPYWESEILDVVCNSGYGNPSGHSVTSTTYYLTLPHIVTNFDFFRKTITGQILRIVIFILFGCLGVLVMISRIMLGAHSINQVIFGFSIGLGIYFILIYILSYHTYDPNVFINYITSALVVIVYMILHFALLILLIIMYFALDDDSYLKNKTSRDIFNGERCKIKKQYLIVLLVINIIIYVNHVIILFIL